MTSVDTLFEKDFDFIFRRTQDNKFGQKKLPLQFTKSDRSGDYRVSQTFLPLVLVSKWIAACPVKIIRSGGDNKILYEFKRLSAPFIFSCIFGTILFLVTFIWITNSLLDNDWPIRMFPSARLSSWVDETLGKGGSLIYVLNTVVRASLPVGALICTILQWSALPSFCQFLNDWPQFFREFELAFFSHYTFKYSLSKKRNLFSVIWLIPVVFLMYTIKPSHFPESSSAITGLGYFRTMFVVGSRSVFFVKDFLCLQTLRMAYEQLLNGIKAEYGAYKTTISRSQVCAWMDMVTFIRKQTSRFEEYMGVPNLYSIFEVFMSILLILAIAVFLFMNNVLFSGGLNGNFIPYAIVCTTFYALSLYWKTFLAEEIANMEEAIAEEIIEMETGDNDCETRLEMKLICDLIYNDPIEIRVWKMLTLNKRLLLAFFSQLASYLVVILQFTKT